jgi:hypothetical protein
VCVWDYDRYPASHPYRGARVKSASAFIGVARRLLIVLEERISTAENERKASPDPQADATYGADPSL